MFLAQKIFLEEDAAKKEEMKKLFIDLLKKKKPDVSEEEVEQQLKLYLAEMMLTLSYSDRDFGQLVSMTRLFSAALPNLTMEESSKKLLKEIFSGLLSDGKFVRESDGRKFTTFPSAISGHRSHFLLECDKNDKPLFVHYIDGNCPFSSDFTNSIHSRLNIALDNAQKALRINQDPQECEEQLASARKIQQEFGEIFPKECQYLYGGAKFKIDHEKFSKFAQHDSHYYRLILSQIEDLKLLRAELFSAQYEKDKKEVTTLELYLPTQSQTRGTCSFKSDLLLVGAILEQVYGLGSKLVDGKPAGKGYEIRKEFKHALIKYYAEQVAEMAYPKHKGKVFHQEACQFLTEVIKPNAERKIERNAETQDSSAFQTASSIRDRIAEYEKKAKRGVQLYDDRPWWCVEAAKLSTDKSLGTSIKESALAALKDLGGDYAKEAAEMGKEKVVGLMEYITIIETGSPPSKPAALAKLSEKYQEAEKKFQQNPGDKNTMVELMALNLLLGKDHENYLSLKKEFLKDQAPATSEIKSPLAHNVQQRVVVTTH